MALLILARVSPLAPAPPASSTAPDASGISGPGGLMGAPIVPTRANVPLLVAGDGRDVWVAQPGNGDSGYPGFELFDRPADSLNWRIATHNGDPFQTQQKYPRSIMMQLPPAGVSGSGSPVIIGDSGAAYSYSLDDSSWRSSIPPSHIVKAATGGPEQLFVITYGKPVPSATRPGDPLPEMAHGKPPAANPVTTAASQAASPTTTAAASTSQSEPATSAATMPETSPPSTNAASGEIFNTYWYPPAPGSTTATAAAGKLRPTNRVWTCLVPLGEPASDAARVPTPSSLIVATVLNSRLVVLWVDPLHPSQLVVRTLELPPALEPKWSEPAILTLPEEVPAQSRLMTAMLDQTLFLVWPKPTGSAIELHGGSFDSRPNADTFKKIDMLPPMPLGAESQGISPSEDVAVAPTENSLLAVIRTTDNALRYLVFDRHGTLLANSQPVESRSPRHDFQIGQSLSLLLMGLIVALSLWQWRQKPAPLVLPKGVTLAPFHLRAIAGAADLLMPYLVVMLIFRRQGGLFGLMTEWLAAAANPEDLLAQRELFVFLGLYVLHVTLGELFFGASAGKSFSGIRVAGLDGSRPSVAAILIRNIIRVPELVTGLAVPCMLISERHQRLGDMAARTIVVTDPGAEADSQKKDAGKP